MQHNTYFLEALPTAAADHPITTPAARPSRLGPFDTGSIVFPDRIPVGGSARATLFENGTYDVSVRLHNWAYPSYDVGVVWLFAARSGAAYALAVTRHAAGKIESGVRDLAWNMSGQSRALAEGWNDIAGSRSYHWDASLSLDLAHLIERAAQTHGVNGTVVVLA